jgi:inhibitor of cysteine peptidase
MGTDEKCRRATLAAVAFLALLSTHIGMTAAEAQNGPPTSQAVSLSVGASTTIALSENPSTGYRWQISAAQSSNMAILRVADGGYLAGQSGLIGAPGSHRWQIKARAPGTAKIVFALSRPWEHATPAEIYRVDVDVTRGR